MPELVVRVAARAAACRGEAHPGNSFPDRHSRQFRPAGRAAPPLAERRAVKVGHDALDDVLAALRPSLRLSAAGERVELTFAALDDFHPDQIFDQVDAFSGQGDDERTDLMRAILHHRDFQAMESAWRGLEWLLRRAAKGRVEVVALRRNARRVGRRPDGLGRPVALRTVPPACGEGDAGA